MFLRQSTASQEIQLGTFVDDTDGKTAETGLTIANTDIKIRKHGGSAEAAKNSGGATHDAGGRYIATLDATDTDTIGMLEINVHVAGALPIGPLRFNVLHANVYDALFGSTALSTHTAAAVWSVGTRELTSGANIALAKGTGVTGFNDLSAAQVNAEVDTAIADVGLTTTITGRIDAAISTRLASASYTAPLDAAGVRSAVGLASANLDTQLDALPTAAENATAVWGAGTRVLTAGTNIALAKGTGVTGFNDLDAAGVRSAVGLASANLDTQLDAVPTASENATAVWGAGTRVLTAGTNIALAKGTGVTGFNDLDAAGIRTAVGLASANLDTQLGAIPTAAEIDTELSNSHGDGSWEGGGGGGGGSVTYETQEVPVGEHYVETGDSLAAFRFRTYQLVDGEFEPYTYDDLELALYIDGVLSGTVPTWTEVSEGVIQLAGTLPTITAGQRLRIEATTVEGDTTNDVWFGIVPNEGGGGGGTAVIGRFDDPDADSPNVTWKVGEVEKPKTVSCVNASGDPIDLEAEFDLTDAYLVIERANPPRTDVQVIAIGDITIGGADGNELTFQANADVLEKPGDFKWSFRQDNESEIACGRITVSYSPMRDA